MISVVPILVLGSMSFYRSREMLQEQALATLETTVSRMEINLENSIERVNRSLNAIAYSTHISQTMQNEYTDIITLKNALDDFVHPLLIMTVGQNADYEDIKLYTSKKYPAYSTLVVPIKDMEQLGDRVSPTLDSNTPYWYFDENIIYASQRCSYLTSIKRTDVINIKINAEKFYEQLIVQDANIVLFDNNGKMLYSKCSCATEDIYKIMEPITEKGGYVTIGDERYMAVKGIVDSSELTFYYFVPTGSVVIDSDNILTTTLILAIVMCIFSLIISIKFSTALSKVLGRLLNAFDVIESGSFDISITNEYQDEIGTLTRRFIRLVNWLKDEIDENNSAHVKVRKAELRSLQAQINPHFLYNTLSLINWKAMESGADELSKVAQTLATFYRTSLSKGADVITLEQELTNVKAYIDIRLFMSNNSFDVEYDIDKTVLNCKVLKLMLQPIVENALDHGMNGLIDRRGKITIRIRRINEMLSIMVIDNGNGMTRKQANDVLTENTTGYGLKNVNERLQYYFGATCGLRIETQQGEGTIVMIEGIRI